MTNLSQADLSPQAANGAHPVLSSGAPLALTGDEWRLANIVAPRIAVVERPGIAGALKRGLDVFLALIALVALSPLLVSAAIAVKLSSKGSVLFAQTRVGKGGKLFKFYKFRSMVTDAEILKAALAAQNEKDGPIFKMAHDPRITRVGRTLRKYSIDELPQLINVLRGDMSLVGPRPPVPSEVVKYEEWHLRRLSVTPGLTCIWQTSGRSRISFEEWMRMDLEYIDTWSFLLDAKLILKTFVTVVTADGAY